MKSLFIVLAVATLFATGNALRCYTCDECGDPFDEADAKITNSSTDTSCIKANIINSSLTLTTRFGTVDRWVKGLTKDLRADDKFSLEMFACRSDLCNGATSVYASLYTLFAFAAILMFSNRN